MSLASPALTGRFFTLAVWEALRTDWGPTELLCPSQSPLSRAVWTGFFCLRNGNGYLWISLWGKTCDEKGILFFSFILESKDLGGKKVSENCSVVFNSLWPHGLSSPWNSPGQNTGVGSLSLCQGIFPTQGSNPGLSHCGQILYQLSYSHQFCTKTTWVPGQ